MTKRIIPEKFDICVMAYLQAVTTLCFPMLSWDFQTYISCKNVDKLFKIEISIFLTEIWHLFWNFQGKCISQVITIAKTEKAQLWKKSKEKNLSFSIMLSSFPSFLNLVTQKFSSFYLLNSANISSNFWVPLQQDRIAESY